MRLSIREEDLTSVTEYAQVPAAFRVDRELDLQLVSLGAFPRDLPEVAIALPYVKDYDALPGNHPTVWLKRFEMSRSGVIAAFLDERRVGGAVIVCDSADLRLHTGDLHDAVLWDIRVAPDVRGRGIGSALFTAAERWARCRAAHRVIAETQHNNPEACRFYARHGCYVDRIVPHAYLELPNEVQLIWQKPLVAGSDSIDSGA